MEMNLKQSMLLKWGFKKHTFISLITITYSFEEKKKSNIPLQCTVVLFIKELFFFNCLVEQDISSQRTFDEVFNI